MKHSSTHSNIIAQVANQANTELVLNHGPAIGISQEIPCKVRLVVDISTYAFEKKIGNTVYLYFVLRSFNASTDLGPWGSGVLPLNSTIDAVVKDYGYSRRTLQRDFNGKGSSNFWTISDGKIHLKGIWKIFEDLGIKYTDCYFKEVPDARKFTTPKQRKAQLYSSQFTPIGRKGKPLTRAYITERTGLAHIQQRRYEIEARVHRTPNKANKKNADGTIVPVLITVQSFSKKTMITKNYRVHKRLGNNYSSRLQSSNKGMLKRSSTRGGTSTATKVFFSSRRRLFKALAHRSGYQEAYYLLKPESRLIPGRLEWCLETTGELLPNCTPYTRSYKSPPGCPPQSKEREGSVEFEAKYEGCSRGRYYR